MARELLEYSAARRLGQKEYASYISQGRNGYLPFLDGVLKNIDIVSEVSLGVVEIPIEKIKGTYTYLRSICFARNFAPLMGEGTEFAEKWQHVYDIQQEEGLRDPIKVYEYLNWFYVVEGNKRVSVLRFCEMEYYYAEVSRLIPKYDENDKDIRIYYAFLDFYKQTGINEIWMTREESFGALWELIRDYYPQSRLSDYNARFKYFVDGVYRPFRRCYQELGGDRLPVSTGDAMLDFMKIHGVPDSYDADTLRPMLKRFLMEIELYASSESIVQTTPAPKQEVGLFGRFTQRPRMDRIKVGFAYANDNKTSSWAYSHELGRMHVESQLKDQVQTFTIHGLPESAEAANRLKELVDAGCKVIFTTSPPLLNATLKVAMEHPDVTFMNCSGWHSFKHVNTYFGRIHEPRFLCGIVAGVMSQSNLLGYVATFPTPDVLCGINAFALGARMVRPSALVSVEWTLKWDTSKGVSREPMERLAAQGVDIISHHNTLANRNFAPEYGVFTIVRDTSGQIVPDRYLAVPVWNWGIFYEKVLRSILSGAMRIGADTAASNPIRNYWWGMDSGLLDFFYARNIIPRDTQKLLEVIKNAIESNVFNPFTGPVYDAAGKLRVEDGEVASHDQIVAMDWLVEGVLGDLPETGDYRRISDLATGKMG